MNSLYSPFGKNLRVCDGEAPCLPGELIALRGNSWYWMDFYIRNLVFVFLIHALNVTSYPEIQCRLQQGSVRASRILGSV